MGRFRPRGNSTKRIIGKAVSMGMREYYRGKRPRSSSSEGGSNGVVIFLVLLFLVLLVQCGS